MRACAGGAGRQPVSGYLHFEQVRGRSGAEAQVTVVRRGLEIPVLPSRRGCTCLGVAPGSPAAACGLSGAIEPGCMPAPRNVRSPCPSPKTCPGPRALSGGPAAFFAGFAPDTSGLCGVRGTHFSGVWEEDSSWPLLGRGVYSRGPRSSRSLYSLPSLCIAACFLIPAHIP